MVSIENPDYNFTVPDHEKADYRELLFKMLAQIEKQQQKRCVVNCNKNAFSGLQHSCCTLTHL